MSDNACMVIHQKEEELGTKLNQMTTLLWDGLKKQIWHKSREHYDIWSDLDIYHEYNIESSRIFEREISKSHLDFKVWTSKDQLVRIKLLD